MSLNVAAKEQTASTSSLSSNNVEHDRDADAASKSGQEKSAEVDQGSTSKGTSKGKADENKDKKQQSGKDGKEEKKEADTVKYVSYCSFILKSRKRSISYDIPG